MAKGFTYVILLSPCEWEVLIKQRIYWIEGQEGIRISQWSQRIMYKLPKLCDKIKGCSGRNCRMSTFWGLQREMDRVEVGPTRVNFPVNPHHTYFTLNGCWSWMSYTISFQALIQCYWNNDTDIINSNNNPSSHLHWVLRIFQAVC